MHVMDGFTCMGDIAKCRGGGCQPSDPSLCLLILTERQSRVMYQSHARGTGDQSHEGSWGAHGEGNGGGPGGTPNQHQPTCKQWQQQMYRDLKDLDGN